MAKDLYAPRKCSATGRLIPAKDHSSVQINVCKVDANGRMLPGQNETVVLSGFVRHKGESDNSASRLFQERGLLHNVWTSC